MRALLVSILFLCGAEASAQQGERDVNAEMKVIDGETRCFVAPGPGEGETRAICVWRPPNAPATRLPTLYMADGMDGVHIALLDMRAAIMSGAMQPVLVMATDPKANAMDRAEEYVRGIRVGERGRGGTRAFDQHEKWWLEFVLPWAERTQRAADDPAHRFIGGFSNGADFALTMALHHPDKFGGALAHSPVGADPLWVGDAAGGQRWVITGGTRETSGSLTRGGDLPRRISEALARKDPVRTCIGAWEHRGRFWRQLTPGSVGWLMGVAAPDAVATPLERDNCANAPR